MESDFKKLKFMCVVVDIDISTQEGHRYTQHQGHGTVHCIECPDLRLDVV